MTAPSESAVRLADSKLDWRAVEGEILALDLESAEYLSINRTGALLWRDLAAGTSREQLAHTLVAETGIGIDRALHDVNAFLRQLAAQGLLIEEVRRREAPASG
jgi:hypothetical protein